MPFISKLYFSPVKSLSFQNISKCEIIKNIGIKNDRVIAFSRNADFKFTKEYPEFFPDNTKQLSLEDFCKINSELDMKHILENITNYLVF